MDSPPFFRSYNQSGILTAMLSLPSEYFRLVCDCCLCILIKDMDLAGIKSDLDGIARTCSCTWVNTNSDIMSLN